MSEMTEANTVLSQTRVPFIFTYVDAFNMDETLMAIEERILARQITQHVVINAGKIVLMEKDKDLREIVNSCPIINADGQSVVWASRFLGHDLPERVTGIDLMFRLIERASLKGYRVYFFGAAEEVVVKTKNHFEQKFPALQVAGYRNGYFSIEDEDSIVRDMRESHADILLIAFSSPKKELWVRDHIDQINIPFVMGVGGSFDIVAGVTKRAPGIMQKMGLEWAFRLFQEPRRMLKRYVYGNSRFVYLVLRYKFHRKLSQ